MKSKKIVALALTAAMAISMASMTAFAATADITISSKAGNYDGTNKAGDEVVRVYEGEKDTGDKEKTKTYQDIVGFIYEIKKADSAETYAKKGYAFKKANGSNTTSSSSTGTDGITHVEIIKAFSDKELDDIDDGSYKFDYDKIKGSLPTYTADGKVHIGWTKEDNSATKGGFADPISEKATDAEKTTAKMIVDGDDDLGISNTSLGKGDNNDIPLTLYPVWRLMSNEEKAAQRNAKTDVAIDPKTNNIYKEGEVEAKGYEVGYSNAEDALAACKAKSVMSRVFDLKAVGESDLYTTDDGGVNVDMINHQKLAVKLAIPGECKTDDQRKALKVFHIDSKGKATQLKITKIDKNDNGYVDCTGRTSTVGTVSFKAGEFSQFVVTWDPKSITTDSEGNPATGEASALPVALLAVAALSATGVVAYKKRKAE